MFKPRRLYFVALLLAFTITARTQEPLKLPYYDILFREVARFQADASAIEKNGGSAEYLRRHHQRKLGLRDQDAATLVSVARSYISSIAPLDKQASEIIQSAKSRFRANPKNGSVPKPPAILQTLQVQKNATIQSCIEALRSSFGDATFTWIDSNIRAYIKRGSENTRKE